MYGLPKSGDETLTTSGELLEKIAIKSGRLLKGGEPCVRTTAIMVICDYQRGRLPHYVAPPELKEDGVKDDQTLKKKEVGVAGGVKDTWKIQYPSSQDCQ